MALFDSSFGAILRLAEQTRHPGEGLITLLRDRVGMKPMDGCHLTFSFARRPLSKLQGESCQPGWSS
jgi:hypothetical protein